MTLSPCDVRRDAALHAIHRFCESEALPLPPHLVESVQDAGPGPLVVFTGTAPDGRQYRIAYYGGPE